jgi:hypothetical protein
MSDIIWFNTNWFSHQVLGYIFVILSVISFQFFLVATDYLLGASIRNTSSPQRSFFRGKRVI